MVLGLVLLLVVANWNTWVFMPVAESMMGGGSAGSGGSTFMGDGEEEAMMEGSLYMPGMLKSLMEGEELDFYNLTMEDMELESTEIVFTNKGIYDTNTGEMFMDMDQGGGSDAEESGGQDQNQGDQPSFPMLGVEKTDYEIWSGAVNDTVTAEYLGEGTVHGKRTYHYQVFIDNESLEGGSMVSMPAEGEGEDGEEDGSGIPMDLGDMEMRYSERTDYYLDPKSSIPLDMDMDMSYSAIMPDFTRLMVQEGESVTTSEGTVRVDNSYFPRLKEEQEVIRESHSRQWLLEEDENIAIFETWTELYDKGTGEPLPEENQPNDYEKFAVDRTTYKFVPAHGNSQRRGYHSFPIGKVEKKSYLTWDPMISQVNTISYQKTESRCGMNCWLFEMTEVDEDYGSMFLMPVTAGEGLTMKYDGFIRYWLDERTGLPIDMLLNGTVSVAPVDAPQARIPVASFEFSFEPEMVEEMKLISDLFYNFLLPLSNSYQAFVRIDMGFTRSMSMKIIEMASDLEMILDITRFWIPFLVGVLALYLILKPMFKYRRERKKGIQVTTIEYKYSKTLDRYRGKRR